MAGAAKHRANRERELHMGHGSSSGDTSSSGKASKSARSSQYGGRFVQSGGSRRGGYDGNRDPDAPGALPERNPATSKPVALTKNLDLGMTGWNTLRGTEVSSKMPPRPQKASTVGQGMTIGLNTFEVKKLPTKPVYQFEVMVGSGLEKRGLIKKVWTSQAVRAAIGRGFIFDCEFFLV